MTSVNYQTVTTLLGQTSHVSLIGQLLHLLPYSQLNKCEISLDTGSTNYKPNIYFISLFIQFSPDTCTA